MVTLKIPYAFEKTKDFEKLVSIENACKDNVYMCPCCGEVLVLKQGTKKQSHFAHKSNTNCTSNPNKSFETALHYKLKDLITKKTFNKFYLCYFEQNFAIDFNEIYLEKKIDNIKPDVYLQDYDGNKYLIEIKVTHESSTKKVEYCKQNNLILIEIDFSYFYKKDTCYDDVFSIFEEIFLNGKKDFLDKQLDLHYEKMSLLSNESFKIEKIIEETKQREQGLNENYLQSKKDFLNIFIGNFYSQIKIDFDFLEKRFFEKELVDEFLQKYNYSYLQKYNISYDNKDFFKIIDIYNEKKALKEEIEKLKMDLIDKDFSIEKENKLIESMDYNFGILNKIKTTIIIPYVEELKKNLDMKTFQQRKAFTNYYLGFLRFNDFFKKFQEREYKKYQFLEYFDFDYFADSIIYAMIHKNNLCNLRIFYDSKFLNNKIKKFEYYYNDFKNFIENEIHNNTTTLCDGVKLYTPIIISCYSGKQYCYHKQNLCKLIKKKYNSLKENSNCDFNNIENLQKEVFKYPSNLDYWET